MKLFKRSIVKVADWTSLGWLRHGFSTRLGGVSKVYQKGAADPGHAGRRGGDLNLGWTTEDDPRNVAENRRLLVAAVTAPVDLIWGGTASPLLVTARQVHSSASLTVGSPPHNTIAAFMGADGRALLEADGLMTQTPEILLGIQTADCVPVLVADVRLRAVACFHAGWRGTAARIVERGVAQMAATYGSRSSDLVAAIGPSIGVCCYSVGGEVYEAFAHQFSYGSALFRSGAGSAPKLHLDLWEANRRQLLESSIPADQIRIVRECTGCSGLPDRRRYFSHRFERGFTGRMLSVIGTIDESNVSRPVTSRADGAGRQGANPPPFQPAR